MRLATAWLRAAHPRSRGEHSTKPLCGAKPLGSSPLARGTPPKEWGADSGFRLIPARAGNTEPRAAVNASTAAHPRSRGEHDEEWADSVRLSGSSPLARGTPAGVLVHRLSDRLIPARAGNTTSGTVAIAIATAHPRSRGEHPPFVAVILKDFGSSPLARGTRRVSVHLVSAVRLIPARAGNTPTKS